MQVNWSFLLVQSFAVRMPLLTATIAFGLGRRCWRSPQWCYLHCLRTLSLPSKHTHTRLFNGPLSGTTRVSQYQKGKTNLDFIEARDSEWQWHHLSHMQVCTSLQTDNHPSNPPLSFYRPVALPAAQPAASKHWRDTITTIINNNNNLLCELPHTLCFWCHPFICVCVHMTYMHVQAEAIFCLACRWLLDCCCSCFSLVLWTRTHEDVTKSTHTHTQPFNGCLARTTRVRWYQKKPPSTHAHEEEEEGFTLTTRSIAWELIPCKVLWAIKGC